MVTVYNMYDKGKGIYLHQERVCECTDVVNTPENAEIVLRTVFNTDILPEEHLYLLAINSKGNVNGVFEVSHGGVSDAYFNPGSIIKRALLVNARSVIVAHNHVSGDCFPSTEDIAACRRLKEACKIIGIDLADFLVVGKNRIDNNSGSFYSFRQNEML